MKKHTKIAPISMPSIWIYDHRLLSASLILIVDDFFNKKVRSIINGGPEEIWKLDEET